VERRAGARSTRRDLDAAGKLGLCRHLALIAARSMIACGS
jgi:hypothetical protein